MRIRTTQILISAMLWLATRMHSTVSDGTPSTKQAICSIQRLRRPRGGDPNHQGLQRSPEDATGRLDNSGNTSVTTRRMRRAKPRVPETDGQDNTQAVRGAETSGPEEFRQFVELLGLRAHTTDEVIDQVFQEGANFSGGRLNFTMCATQVNHAPWTVFFKMPLV
jgi:hypothetical protein